MATLATLFVSALSNIQPGDDAKNAPMAHKQVSDAITSDQLLRELGADPVLIGSYKRDVSIRRVKDVDAFVRLKNADDSLRPGDILTHTIEVLEDAFPGRVTRQHRSAMVDFPKFDLSVDVVIARPCGNHPDDHWQIPQKIEQDGRASWVETNPTRMTELKTQANQQFLLSDDDPTSGATCRSSSSSARSAAPGTSTSPAASTSRCSPTRPSKTSSPTRTRSPTT